MGPIAAAGAVGPLNWPREGTKNIKGVFSSVANPDQYFRYTASFKCHNFAYNCNSCTEFHSSIILDTYQIYWNDSSIRQDKKISSV